MSTSSPTDTTTATTTTTTTLDTATAGRPLSPTPSFAATGFVTSHLCSPHALPIVLRAIPSVVCLLLGLCLTFLSVYAGRWGTRLGKQRGDGSSAGWLGGGVRGVWVGALVMPQLLLLSILAILGATANGKPSMGNWLLFLLLASSSILGAILVGKWRWATKVASALLGSLSLTLLLTVTLRLSTQLIRLVFFFVILLLSLLLLGCASVPRFHLGRTGARAELVWSALAGSWTIVCGIDWQTRMGLVDAFELLASNNGIVSPQASDPTGAAVPSLVRWNEASAKGLVAGCYLIATVGIAFQMWRYQKIGEDPQEEWNAYLGTILSNKEEGFANSRSGVFESQRSFFSRMFSSSPNNKKTQAPASYSRGPGHVPLYDRDDTEDPGELDAKMFDNVPERRLEELDFEMDLPKYPVPFTVQKSSFFRHGTESHRPARYESMYTGITDLGDADAKSDGGEDAYEIEETELFSHEGCQYYLPKEYGRTLKEQDQTNTAVYVDYRARAMVPVDATDAASVLSTPSLSGTTIYGSVSTWNEAGTLTSLPEENDVASERGQSTRNAQALDPRTGKSAAATLPTLRPVSTDLDVAVPATPSLINAIKRVSQAQEQAKRVAGVKTLASSSRSPAEGHRQTTSPVLQKDQHILRAAAQRRQSTAEWWNEVERRASMRGGGGKVPEATARRPT